MAFGRWGDTEIFCNWAAEENVFASKKLDSICIFYDVYFLAPIHFSFFRGLQLFVDLACCFCSYVSRCCMSYHGCSLTPIMRVRGEREIDRWIGAAVMWTLGQSIMVKRENSRKVKLSVCLFIYDPTLTYGCKLFVVTGHVPPGWDPGVDPGHTGENTYFVKRPWGSPGKARGGTWGNPEVWGSLWDFLIKTFLIKNCFIKKKAVFKVLHWLLNSFPQ